MGDAIQQQLDRLLTLFQQEQTANMAHREALNARIDALSQGGGSGGSGGGEDEGSGHRTNRHGGGTVPRYAKLDFPKYGGLEDPLGWISRCEHFFNHQQTPEAEKVGLASFHLEGNAQLWYLQLLEDYPGIAWEEFKGQCHLRFGPPIRSNKLGELAKLKQSGTVAAYQTQFEVLVSRAGALSQFQKIQLYLSGLKDHIAVEVELHQPRDLATAMSMSRLYEKKDTTPGSEIVPKTSALSTPSDRPVKRFTQAELADRRRRGLCFNCDEQFTRGHQCAKLFWFELCEAEPPDPDQQPAPST